MTGGPGDGTASDETDHREDDSADGGSDLLVDLADGTPGDVYRAVAAVSTVRLVLAITAVALLARLVALGARPMHYDEGRVGYWILHYVDTGAFTYRHGIHGPFVQHVNRFLFPIVGASDFAARLPVAVVGGLLPLGALLFRDHLKKPELVALAFFLSFNSVLVYYSRFMRSDVLLAGFMFAAFGCLVRFYDTRDVRYLYGLAVLAAFGFATKENAIVYALTWVGAAGLLADQALFRPRQYRNGLGLLQARATEARARWREWLPRHAGHTVGAVAVFLFVLVFMYADRGAGMAGVTAPPAPPEEGAVGFWEALASPLGFPGYAYDTLAGAASEALQWGGRTGAGDSESLVDTYVSHLGTDLEVLASNAPILMVFAGLGFLWERYGRATSRNLVLFAGYCGFVSLLGYPLADDIGSAHWLHVHILVPLAIPAAVAVARLYEWGRTASADRDAVATAAVAFILLLAAFQVGAATASDAYLDTTSTDNELVQFAQPESDARVAVTAIDMVAGDGGTDVVIYTRAGYDGTRPLVGGPDEGNHSFALRPACQKSDWYNSLPLPWYLADAGADVACETDPGELASTAAAEEPALIITLEDDTSVPSGRLRESYTARTFDMYQWSHRMTFYLHDDRAGEVPGWERAGDRPAR
jgi:uncharacterized protein (TIGR03663 family)